MPATATEINAYLDTLPEDRRATIESIRKSIRKNLPKGFAEGIGYGMISYVVPHSKYPAGYHCNPKVPLPFMSIGSNKSGISLHHLGLYGDEKLLKWFTDEYAKAGVGKLDMGKGCVRFKNPEQIPYDLIGKLAAKITPDQWIEVYEKNLMTRKK